MHCFPQRLKSMFFEKNQVKGTFSTLRREPGLKKLFQKMFHLVFEVIAQPPKHTYEIGFFCILAHYALYQFPT